MDFILLIVALYALSAVSSGPKTLGEGGIINEHRYQVRRENDVLTTLVLVKLPQTGVCVVVPSTFPNTPEGEDTAYRAVDMFTAANLRDGIKTADCEWP